MAELADINNSIPDPEDDAPVMGDLFHTIIDLLQYDFCEDDDGVQGNWQITRDGDQVTITYLPYDVSPFPKATATYRVTRIS